MSIEKAQLAKYWLHFKLVIDNLVYTHLAHVNSVDSVSYAAMKKLTKLSIWQLAFVEPFLAVCF